MKKICIYTSLLLSIVACDTTVDLNDIDESTQSEKRDQSSSAFHDTSSSDTRAATTSSASNQQPTSSEEHAVTSSTQSLSSGEPSPISSFAQMSSEPEVVSSSEIVTPQSSQNHFSSFNESSAESIQEGPVTIDITSLTVRNSTGDSPKKGDALSITFTAKNNTPFKGSVTIKPVFRNDRFIDYADVVVATLTETFNPYEERDITLTFGPLFVNPENNKRFALGSGEYTVDSIVIHNGQTTTMDSQYAGKTFTLASSNKILVASLYDQAYLNHSNYSGTALEYLKETYTRPAELFMQSIPQYVIYDGGFDQLMGVEHIFDTVEFDIKKGYGENYGFCEEGVEQGRAAFGVDIGNWSTNNQSFKQNHGFDYLLGMTDIWGGGVTCSWIGVQMSGVIGDSFDQLGRNQMVLIHETGHVFGAPHCNDITEGGANQAGTHYINTYGAIEPKYLMCSGERHENYISDRFFVWHEWSKERMDSFTEYD